jgi:hypothetical protein
MCIHSLETPPNLIETKMVGFRQEMSGKEMCFHCQEKYYVIVYRHGCKHGW